MTKKELKSVEFIYCGCGCGKTRSKYRIRDNLQYKSEPRFFIIGHDKFGKSPVNRKGDVNRHGYHIIYKPNHRLAQSNGYILKHRVLFEEYYSCCLLPWSAVHHINGIKNDNRKENLEGMTWLQHRRLHVKLKRERGF